MKLRRIAIYTVCAVLALAPGMGSAAEFVNGGKAPVIIAQDINGKDVNINELIEQEPHVVIVHFFSVSTGKEVAEKLRFLHLNYGRDRVRIVALGMKEDEAALKQFAEALDIRYFIINSDSLQNPDWLNAIDVLPMTLFVHPSKDLVIERVIRGGGKSRADVLKQLAETLFRKRQDAEMAVELTDEAAKEAPDAAELKGFILAAEGKLDEAEQEFSRIDSKAGLALVAKERGDFDKAVAIADEAGNDAYAQTVKGQVLMEQGKMDEAREVLNAAASSESEDTWKQSDTLNAQGRLEHATGNVDGALSQYQNAVALDPLNVVALSNEGAAYRSKGDAESLRKAEEVLSRASTFTKDDQLITTMLQQIQVELKNRNDVERRQLIQQQIQTLSERYKERMANQATQPIDNWSTRPLVLAFLPSSDQAPVFFERAGTEVILQRELETRIQNSGQAEVVEREMLDQLLQELNLGTSEIASADTQQRLGQVLSAGVLGFINYGAIGNEKLMYLRAVDTETTRIVFQTSQPVNEQRPLDVVTKLQDELIEKLSANRELKGLIAEAAADDAIIISLGSRHGVQQGYEFTVLEEGEPITAGGREIARRQTPIAKIRVVEVEPDYAICTLVNRRDGAVLAKEMKIRRAAS